MPINKKTPHAHGLKNNVKMSVLPKPMYRFNAGPIKITTPVFCKNMKIHLKIWNLKGPQTAKTILKKKKVEGVTLSDFKTYYKAMVIKIVPHWHKD